MTTAAQPKPKICIFCGQRPLTREHMWANWMGPYIDRTLSKHGMRSQTYFPDTGKIQSDVRFQPGDTHSRKIKCVCADCNNVWMSQLQERSKPHLVPMLQDRPKSLNRKEQTLVSAWVTMTVMVSEFLDRGMVAISAQERERFREQQTTPKHWRIWIGRYQRAGDISRWSHNVMTLVKKGESLAGYSPDEPNTQTSTICFGQHLIIHVMSSVVAKDIIRRWQLPPSAAPAFRQIWPVTDAIVSWPSAGTLGATDISLVSDQLLIRAANLARNLDVGLSPPAAG